MKNLPLVSVIIPLFNAEKYLGACLESLLIQTLKNLEVIVVDDCSTDSSPVLAESYLEKFGGRLKIITLPQNTGSGAVPRNVGLEYAQGKYVFFMDADDLIVDNALERLYNFAEEYRAEVIYMERCYLCDAEKNLTLAAWTKAILKNKILFESENLGERVHMLINFHFYWPPWSKFLRRDFLIDNDIKFPQMTIAEDVVWTFKILCLSKNFLRIPTPLYIYRSNETSMMGRKRSLESEIIFWTNPLILGLDCLDEFMRGLEYFQKNPVVRLQVLNFFALMQFDNMKDALGSLDAAEVYEIFLQEFTKAGSTQPALISYLLLMTNLYRNELKALT